MPILDAYSFEFVSRSADQTRRLGQRLGGLLQTGDLVCLSGDLGAGKTTLVQGIAQGWGSLDPVSSPTFVLANGYRRTDDTLLNHLDAYRLNGPAEAEDLDLEMMIEKGPLVIEWAERIDAALPADRLAVLLRWAAEEQRVLFFRARGIRAQTILDSFRKWITGG
jgi:tRNA threonylcarbamoyladenosine biosynthesis protein TsaE